MANPFGDLAEEITDEDEEIEAPDDSFDELGAGVPDIQVASPESQVQNSTTTNPFGNAAEAISEAPEAVVTSMPKEAKGVNPAIRTLQNIGQVYPVVDTALNAITSTYGIPLSGLGGLLEWMSVGGDLESAGKTVNWIQNALIHKPMTPRGAELTETAAYPMKPFTKAGEFVGDRLDQAGHPTGAAIAKTAIEALPVIYGGRAMLKHFRSTAPEAIKTDFSKTVKDGMGAVGQKSAPRTYGQLIKGRDHAETVVTDIINNVRRGDIEILDADNNVVKGPPQTVEQMAQAIDQGKKNIFKQMEDAITETEQTPVQSDLRYPLKPGEKVAFEARGPSSGYSIETPRLVDLNRTSKLLDEIANKESVRRFSPETIRYLEDRKKALEDRGGKLTPSDTQESIAVFNESLKQYYKDPTPATKGRALVDALIVNDLRKQLDGIVEGATGAKYQGLKDLYGSYKELEGVVNKKAYQIAKREKKSLVDMSDIFSTHQVVKGIMAGEPGTVAAGISAKVAKGFYKMAIDPDRKIKNMFKKADDLLSRYRESGGTPPQNPNRAPEEAGPFESPDLPFDESSVTSKKPSVNRTNMMIPLDEMDLPVSVKRLLGNAKYEFLHKTGKLFKNKDLWKETGFWLGSDSKGQHKWRYEIGPEKAKYKYANTSDGFLPPGASNAVLITDILDYPELFQAIPAAKKFKLKIDPTLDTAGLFNRDQKILVLKKANDTTTLWHELQHAINDDKKAAPGTNANYQQSMITREAIDKILTGTLNAKLIESMKDLRDKTVDYLVEPHHITDRIRNLLHRGEISWTEAQDAGSHARNASNRSPWIEYLKDPGEHESRIVETRMKMPLKDRQEIPPWLTAAEHDQALLNAGQHVTPYDDKGNFSISNAHRQELYRRYYNGNLTQEQVTIFKELQKRGKL